VNEIFGGDEALMAFLQRAVGYALTGWTLEQVFFFCYGAKGANGKSTLFDVLRALLGDYATNTSFSTFTGDAYKGSHQEELMVLENARLVTALESSHAGGLNEAVVKIVTGGDPLTGSRKYQRSRTFMPRFKLWLAANALPRVKDVSPAFWRRVILLPFNERFEGERADKHLAGKLRAELPGILNWALAGCAAYQQQGLNPPRRCVDAAEAWRADNDLLAEFLAACKVGAREEIQAGELYSLYERWCVENGVAQAVKGANHFSRLIQAHGFEKVRRARAVYFIGIGGLINSD
jgi:putative DNA primase/helicase